MLSNQASLESLTLDDFLYLLGESRPGSTDPEALPMG